MARPARGTGRGRGRGRRQARETEESRSDAEKPAAESSPEVTRDSHRDPVESGRQRSALQELRSAKVQRQCDAIDAEEAVASRAAFIRAHTASCIATFNAQLDLHFSKLTKEEQTMTVDEYVRSFPRGNQFPVKEGVHKAEESEPEVMSWQKYLSRLQSLGYDGEQSGSSNVDLNVNVNLKTPMGHTSFQVFTTPRTVRLRKRGEMIQSVNGSPSREFGKVLPPAVVARVTRSQTR